MKKLFLILALFLSLGFVHPPDYAMDKWMNRIKTVRTLHIKQTRFLNLSGRTDQIALEEEVWIYRTGLYRRVARTPRREIHYFVESQRAGRIENGQLRINKLPEVVHPHELPYFAGSSSRLATLLRQSGIDAQSSHWVLENDIEALAVGDLKADRFVFDKGRYFPLAAHFGNYGFYFPVSRQTKFRIPFPEKIEIFRDDELKETVQVHEVNVNVPIAKSFFEVSKLLSKEGERKNPSASP